MNIIFHFVSFPWKLDSPYDIWSYLAICKINECFCEYLALQLAQTNGFFPSWTASIWFNKLRFDEKQLTHWSHLNGVSYKYHDRFMVSLSLLKTSSNFDIGNGADFFLQKLFSLKLFQFFSCFQASWRDMFWKICSWTEIYKTNQNTFNIWQ